MEILDEYQDTMGQTVAGDVAVANIASIAAGMAHHRHSPDSSTSHQDEDLSDPDRQDEESGEELPPQPLQSNNHSSADNTPASTPIAHLNSLMNSTHPHFLAKIKLENDMEMLNNKSSLEALQMAMSGGAGFNLPFSFPSPGAFLAPGQAQQLPAHPVSSLLSQTINNNNNSSTNNNNGNNNGLLTGNHLPPSSSSSHSSESSQGSGRNNGLETTGLRDSGMLGGSSHSQSGSQSQSAAHQQQTTWSFEEQFKQVRQLYEINDDPKRKEFLDDLFSYMQKRGSPINRLPIMAKSVLDLYELYNLVIARGGLVDVINKKLWQEIIKGLHLPSSITSAAFTLRTQYMKYLYPYECEKKHLSTPAELQAAIDGNRREGRRSNYGAYGGGGGGGGGGGIGGGPGSGIGGGMAESLVRGGPHTPGSLAQLHAQLSPLSLVTAVQQAAAAGGQHQVQHQNLVNGSAAHTPLPHHPHHPQHQQGGLGQTPSAGIAPDFEVRMAEYVKHLQREMGRRAGATSPSSLMSHHHRQGSTSPPTSTAAASATTAAAAAAAAAAMQSASAGRSPGRDAALFEMSRLTLWNMYNNNLHPGMGYQPAVSPQPSSHSPQPQQHQSHHQSQSQSQSSHHQHQTRSASPEPQKEALDLGLRSSPSSSSPAQQSPLSSSASIPIKRELEHSSSAGQTPNKRLCMDDESPGEHSAPGLPGTHIKISSRGDGRDKSLVVSMELNGVMYQGVLFAQTDGGTGVSAASTNNNNNNNESKTSSRNVVS